MKREEFVILDDCMFKRSLFIAVYKRMSYNGDKERKTYISVSNKGNENLNIVTDHTVTEVIEIVFENG